MNDGARRLTADAHGGGHGIVTGARPTSIRHATSDSLEAIPMDRVRKIVVTAGLVTLMSAGAVALFAQGQPGRGPGGGAAPGRGDARRRAGRCGRRGSAAARRHLLGAHRRAAGEGEAARGAGTRARAGAAAARAATAEESRLDSQLTVGVRSDAHPMPILTAASSWSRQTGLATQATTASCIGSSWAAAGSPFASTTAVLGQ